MSRSDHLKEKHGQSTQLCVINYDEDSAARTRPFSFEEIMLRRRNKELLENVKETTTETRSIPPGGSSEKIGDHFESANIDKHDKSSASGREKHSLEELVNVDSRKKVQSTYIKEDDLTEGKDRKNYIFETKSSAELNNRGRNTKEKTGKELSGLRKKQRMSDDCEYEVGNKHSRDLVNMDRYAEIDRPKSERKTKKNSHAGDDENPSEYRDERKHDKDRHDRGNPHEYHSERKHAKDRHDRGKTKKHLNNDSKDVVAKKHCRDSADKDWRAEDRAKYEREIKRKYRNGDDATQDRNTSRKQDLVKHHNLRINERKEGQEKVKSRYEESTAKRRRSRSRECEDRRRRSPSFSPRAQKHSYRDGERKELSMLSLKDKSRKKHSDVDRSRVSTNGSSNHHHRHGGSTSGLGGYSPRKRKSEAAVKTPSPSKQSEEKKRAGWDLPPTGTDNPSAAFASSSFQLSNYPVLSNMHDVAVTTSVDLAIVKPLPVSFLSDLSTRTNGNIDSVQLTQATRPMRRLYLENLPASASEKDVMDCFNDLLLSAGVNHIRQAQPCINCILHKDRGQALVEFLTAEDASAALSFDGRTLFGSTVKIRRPKDYVEVAPKDYVEAAPKDYVEVATRELERSVDAAVTISDAVIDSPDKIFIGGISNNLSSEMIMEIVAAFGSLKAFHFETEDSNGSYAFVEYVDHSVTIKACAGLNGMKLGGEVLTVVQAMPDASPMENGGKPPSYGIPEHAKPLLRKPTQVLKIKNVFTMASISSLADMAIEEVLEDVRLECARFGAIKSLNVVKHSSDKNIGTKLDDIEVINQVDSKEASRDSVCVIDNTERRFSEKVTDPNAKGTNGVDFHDEKELEEGKVIDGSGVDVDKNADEGFDDESCQEQLLSDTAVDDTGNESIPNNIIQECPHHQERPKDGPELHDKMVAENIGLDIENKTVGGIMDSNNTVCTLQENISERDASLICPKKGTDKEDDINDDVFEPGSVLVEYGRTEACCSAAHCLHGRIFDGRMATVEYVSLNLYRERFTK